MTRGIILAILPLLGILAFTGTPQRKAILLFPPDSLPGAINTPRIAINLDKAIDVQIDPNTRDLAPVVFHTSDGKRGWGVRIPGARPIATPCFADGLLFVGGGYGSRDFHAFDATTGRNVWSVKTSDDGPTAAVEEDGYVAFNTESCTVIVVEAKTGKLVWQEWLGDPLMSQPAVSNGRLFISHPASGRGNIGQTQSILPHANVDGSQLPPSPWNGGDSLVGGSGNHRMLCADLRTGRHVWSYAIPGDVITAPVVDGDRLYFTCFNGTSFCLNAVTGEELWQEENAGTSAPLIVRGQAIFSARDEHNGSTVEGMVIADTAGGRALHGGMFAAGDALHLLPGGGGGVGISQEEQAALDGSVGFSTPPATAKLGAADRHLGVSTVVGAWAYQGARAVYDNGRLMNAQGVYLNSVDADQGALRWRAEAQGVAVGTRGQIFLPPAVGGGNLYVATILGHLLSVRSDDGALRFNYNVHHPIAFQPVLANGNMYVGTTDGWLICLQLEDPEADGWYAWGGNGAHNKVGE